MSKNDKKHYKNPQSTYQVVHLWQTLWAISQHPFITCTLVTESTDFYLGSWLPGIKSAFSILLCNSVWPCGKSSVQWTWESVLGMASGMCFQRRSVVRMSTWWLKLKCPNWTMRKKLLGQMVDQWDRVWLFDDWELSCQSWSSQWCTSQGEGKRWGSQLVEQSEHIQHSIDCLLSYTGMVYGGPKQLQ